MLEWARHETLDATPHRSRPPRYATLARWLSTAERTQRAKPALLAMWQQVMLRATLILNDRIEEVLESADLMQILKGYERIYRLQEQSRHVAGYCACANR